jgi:hypothetical protein
MIMNQINDKFDEIVNAEELQRMVEWGADSEMLKIQNNAMRLRNNKDDFDKELARIGGCRRYLPCPVCYKCESKSSHLYIKCQLCRIPACVHTYKEKEAMIKRANFFVLVTGEIMTAIREKAEMVNCV